MGTEKHVFLCGAYIPPINSKYYNSELFEELENDISDFSSMGQIVLLGDLNARTGKYNHYIADDKNDTIRFPASLEISFIQIVERIVIMFLTIMENNSYKFAKTLICASLMAE